MKKGGKPPPGCRPRVLFRLAKVKGVTFPEVASTLFVGNLNRISIFREEIGQGGLAGGGSPETESRKNKAHDTEGKGVFVGPGNIEQVPAEPGSQDAAHAHPPQQEAPDRPEVPPVENIGRGGIGYGSRQPPPVPKKDGKRVEEPNRRILTDPQERRQTRNREASRQGMGFFPAEPIRQERG